ncbi:MAG: hypothetical protein J7L15_03025 [Clostridiales bacterium]|nr:hypothetical protein [Clostridiales bacterium]
MGTVRGIYIDFGNLTEEEQIELLLHLFDFAKKELPKNKILFISPISDVYKKMHEKYLPEIEAIEEGKINPTPTEEIKKKIRKNLDGSARI